MYVQHNVCMYVQNEMLLWIIVSCFCSRSKGLGGEQSGEKGGSQYAAFTSDSCAGQKDSLCVRCSKSFEGVLICRIPCQALERLLDLDVLKRLYGVTVRLDLSDAFSQSMSNGLRAFIGHQFSQLEPQHTQCLDLWRTNRRTGWWTRRHVIPWFLKNMSCLVQHASQQSSIIQTLAVGPSGPTTFLLAGRSNDFSSPSTKQIPCLARTADEFTLRERWTGKCRRRKMEPAGGRTRGLGKEAEVCAVWRYRDGVSAFWALGRFRAGHRGGGIGANVKPGTVHGNDRSRPNGWDATFIATARNSAKPRVIIQPRQA